MMRRSLFLLVNFEPVFMPALSPSMESGTIVEWKKKVGDLVKEGDVFCTVQTDKAVADYTNSFDPGYLAKIFVNNGQEAQVAKTIAVLVDNADDVAKADEFKLEDGQEEAPASEPAAAATPEPAAAAPATPASQPAAAAASGTTSELPDGVTVEPVFMPALSPSMESGTIVEWKKKVGDLVKEGDVFCTVQTDKAVADYTNSFDPGYLAKIYCQNGEEATVGLTIGVLVDDKAMIEKLANYRPEDAAGAAPAPAAAAAATPAAPKPAAATAPAQALYGGSVDAAVAASGPSVIRIAAGLEPSVLASIKPTGKDGRFLKADFAGQPGFDYNDAAPARAMEAHGGAAAPAASKSKSAAAAPKAPAMGSDYYSVVIQPGFVKKSVDDTAVLKHLISTMTLPKPKPKKDAKAAN